VESDKPRYLSFSITDCHGIEDEFIYQDQSGPPGDSNPEPMD
jgi:hypothetical protein